MKRFGIFVFAVWIVCVIYVMAEAKIYVAEPYLVENSAYSGTEFYVYRPYNMPAGWFVTFDGFAVTKTKDDVWVYGTVQGGAPAPTNYIVGTVSPALAGIIPYHSAREREQLELARQPVGAAANQVPRQVYMPDWAVNPGFLAFSNWRGSVDRVGVLVPLGVPVVWKGENPRAIFAWTGKKWSQINVRESQRAIDALKLGLYSLTKLKNTSGFNWYKEDTNLLRDKAVALGYYWMGEVGVR